MLKKVYALLIILLVSLGLNGNFSFAEGDSQGGCKVSGYIDVDFTYSKTASPNVKSGFKVEITNNTKYTALTDESGYFEIILADNSEISKCDIIISKPGYLSRIIKNIIPNYPVLTLSDTDKPIKLLAGDIPNNGKQDSVINMADIVSIAKCFGTKNGDTDFNEICDFNRDNKINMADIMIMAKSFNMTISDYPEYIINYGSSVTPKPTVPATLIATATPPKEQWVPYELTPEQISLSVKKDSKGIFYGIVELTFPDGGYRVSYDDEIGGYTDLSKDDSQIRYMINVFKPKVERWTGGSCTVITKKTLVYNLGIGGELVPYAKYIFSFTSDLNNRISLQFTSDSDIPLLSPVTPTVTPTPAPKDQWVPYELSPEQISINVKKDAAGFYYGVVQLDLPDSGYRVSYDDETGGYTDTTGDWQMTYMINVFKPKVERWTGPSSAVITNKTLVYKLNIGTQLVPFTRYVFSFTSDLNNKISYQFTSDSDIPLLTTVTPTATPSVAPTPTPSEQWVPYELSPEQISICVKKDLQGFYYGIVELTFPDSGYRVSYDDEIGGYIDSTGDWQTTYMINVFKPKVERWTGPSCTVMTKKTLVYKLTMGTLIPFTRYVFSFTSDLNNKISFQFTSDTDIPLLPTVTPIATSSAATPTVTPTPEPKDQWVPYELSPEQISLNVKKDATGFYYGIVELTFPDSGYRVSYEDETGGYSDGRGDWQMRYMINVFKPKVERWTGASCTVMTKKTLVYKLDIGTILTPFTRYVFSFTYDLNNRISFQFTSDSDIPLLSTEITATPYPTQFTTPIPPTSTPEDPKGEWVQCSPLKDWISVSVSKDSSSEYGDNRYLATVKYNFPDSGYKVDYVDRVGIVSTVMSDGTTQISFKPVNEPIVKKWTGKNDGVPTEIKIAYSLFIKKGSSKNKYIFTYRNGSDNISCQFAAIPSPTSTASSLKAKSVAAGEGFTVVLKDDGTFQAWGTETNNRCDVPKDLKGVKAISAGLWHGVALKDDGTVALWGCGDEGQLDVPEGLKNVAAVSAGSLHTLALKEDGTVVSWGGGEGLDYHIPKGLNNVKAIAAGGYHSLALKKDGTVVAWGLNADGQCNIPAGLKNVKAIAAGQYHSIALKDDGTVIVWGSFGRSEVCDVPAGLKDVKAIDGGDSFTVAVKEDGTVVAWGTNFSGQCEIPYGLTNVKNINAGPFHTIALNEDGTIAAWGSNKSGECDVPQAQ